MQNASKTLRLLNLSKMVVKHNVKGYEEFTKLVESLEAKAEPIHVFFSGGKQENGESWCPYCVKGEFRVFVYLSCSPI